MTTTPPPEHPRTLASALEALRADVEEADKILLEMPLSKGANTYKRGMFDGLRFAIFHLHDEARRPAKGPAPHHEERGL